METPHQHQQNDTIGTITLFDTAALATAGVAFAVGAAPLGGALIAFVGARTAWRWHRDSIVRAADHALTDGVQTYQTVKALPQTARRIASTVHERVHTAATTDPLTTLPTDNLDMAGTDIITLVGGKIHLLIVGHTGGGKSVLLHNIAAHLAVDADVLVVDVDAIAGRYPGYRVVGAGDNYDAITTALQLVRKEVAKRRDARAGGTRAFKPMWLFIDEAHDVFASVDGARELFIDIVRRGRKLNVHACIGTQDSQVKTLGLEGQSKALVNLTRVDVALTDQGRGATVDGATHPIPPLPHPDDMVVVGHINNAVVVPAAPQATHTRPPDHQTDTPPTGSQRGTHSVDGALLAALLDSSLPQSGHQSVSDQAPDQTRPQTTPDQTNETPQTTDVAPDQGAIDEEIRSKLAAGMSKNKVWEWLREQGITSSKGTAYAMINAAVAASTPDGDGGLADYLGDRTW